MKSIRLGRSELQVSEIGFGGIPIIPLPLHEAVDIVRHAYDLGITFFDTANAYYNSENKMGSALAAVRDQVVIATKTTARDAAQAEAHIHLSLKQLRSDRIDLYQLHNVSNDDALQQVLAPGGACEAVFKAREAGKIRNIGITSHSIRTAMSALKTGLFQTLQFPFNFIEQDPADALFPLAREKDIGIIGMKPLGGGLLGRADLCFRYLQQHAHVVPIPGFKAVAEVDEVVALYRERKPLSTTDLQTMADVRAALGEKFCHRCEYCMPCDQGVQIPSVLIFQAAAKRLSRDAVKGWIGKAMESVANCIECGECEAKCPYELPIADLLQENLSLYKVYTQS